MNSNFFKSLKSVLWGIVFGLYAAGLSAQAPLVLYTESTSAGVGGTVEVVVRVKNFNDIVSGQFSLHWDPTVLNFAGADSITLVGTFFGTDDAYTTGNLSVIWVSNDTPLEGNYLPDGAVLFRLRFNVWSTGSTPIQFVNEPTPLEFAVEGSPTSTIVGASTIGSVVNATYIAGKVFVDNNDCELQDNEAGLKNIPLVARNTTTNESYYANTDVFGNYKVYAPYGNYTVRAILPNKYWQNCSESLTATITAQAPQAYRKFAVNSWIDCADLRVDIATPHLKRCTDTRYTVTYANVGTTVATGAYVAVQFPEGINFQNATLPAIQQGNQYLFFLPNAGMVAAGGEGKFYIHANISCMQQEGQAPCVRAQIFPNDSCLPADPAWDGSHLTVEGSCIGDSIQFIIRNEGTTQVTETQSFVIEDDLMLIQQPIKLDGGEVAIYKVPATGSTYRMQCQQVPGHPGMSTPTRAVEGCTTTGSFTKGFVLQFPEDEDDVFIATDCQEVKEPTTATATTELRGFPYGFGSAHYIDTTTQLDYVINFSNTTPDTVEYIEIIDTLSSLLDVTTLQAGASSHPYTYNLYDKGIIKFVFENTALPNSSTNEAASQGFVGFRIAQRAANPVGSIIFNSAAIILNYQADTLLTNQVYHTVGEQFVERVNNDTEPTTPQENTVKIYPNPFDDIVTFDFSRDFKPYKDCTFRLFDAQGREVLALQTDTPILRITRQQLPAAGLYAYQWLQGTRQLSGYVALR